VPDMTPPVDMVRPGGSAPAVTAYVTVPNPPVCDNDWLYATPAVPLGSVAGEIVIAGQSMINEYVRDPVQLLPSVAVTVKLNVPVMVEVPDRRPPADSVIPAGKAPAVTAYVTVPTPPVWDNDWLYAIPAVPFGKVAGAIVIEGQAIVIEYVREPVQLLPSVAVTVKLNVPVTVGVPDTTPPVDSVMPAGKAPAVTAYVTVPTPPVWDNVWLYATPAVPLGIVAGVTVIAGQAITNV
jgi:hypothetical protein